MRRGGLLYILAARTCDSVGLGSGSARRLSEMRKRLGEEEFARRQRRSPPWAHRAGVRPRSATASEFAIAIEPSSSAAWGGCAHAQLKHRHRDRRRTVVVARQTVQYISFSWYTTSIVQLCRRGDGSFTRPCQLLFTFWRSIRHLGTLATRSRASTFPASGTLRLCFVCSPFTLESSYSSLSVCHIVGVYPLIVFGGPTSPFHQVLDIASESALTLDLFDFPFP